MKIIIYVLNFFFKLFIFPIQWLIVGFVLYVFWLFKFKYFQIHFDVEFTEFDFED
jgi:hypothetical protein